MMSRIRVVSIGHATLDHVFLVENIPRAPIKVRARAFASVRGGMAANAAAAVARLGGEAVFVGPVGDDSAGEMIARDLAGRAVSVAGLRRIAGESTSVSTVLVDRDGERLIVTMLGGALGAQPDPEDLRHIAGAAVVMADTRWIRGAVPLLRAARQQGILTVIDGDMGNPGELSRLIEYADVAAFSAPGLAEWAGTDDHFASLTQARQAGAHIALVTLGERGVAWLDEAGMHALPAHRVVAVDTTGAGDCWHGALALALGGGARFDDAVRFANAAAAIKVTRPGAAAVPTADEVLALLAAHPDAHAV
jgi:sulfofructose kinase